MDNNKMIIFPHVTAENLTLQYKADLEEASRKKDWKCCAVCQKRNDELGNQKLKRCPNCGNTLEGVRIYYCSRECQRRDWTDHRRNCGQHERAYNQQTLGSCREDIKYARYINKMWVRWTSGRRPLTAWLLAQLVHSGAQVDYRNTVVKITYRAYPGVSSKQLRISNDGSGYRMKGHKAEVEHWGFYFAPYATSFEILSRSAFYERYDHLPERTSEEAMVLHVYRDSSWVQRFSIGNISFNYSTNPFAPSNSNSLPLSNPNSSCYTHLYSNPDNHASNELNELNERQDESRAGFSVEAAQLTADVATLRNWRCQQWSWIFCTLSLLGETSEEVGQLKLDHFLTLMRPILSPEPNHIRQNQGLDKQDTLDTRVYHQNDKNLHSLLSKFKAPLFPDVAIGLTKITIDPDAFMEWQSFVGSVIDY